MVRRYVDFERKAGRSASQKRAWRQAKVEMPTASHRQVVDALRKVEGITKMRGKTPVSIRTLKATKSYKITFCGFLD